MKVNDFFEKVFVINLPHRRDRLENFNIGAVKNNISYEVFTGFNGKIITSDFEYNGKKISFNGEFKNLSSYNISCIGATISHLEILKKCKIENIKNVLILEDDTSFIDDFEGSFDTFSNSFIEDWDLLFLSGTMINSSKCNESYSFLHSCYSLNSYSVNNSAYDFLIEMIENNMFIQPVDVTYFQLMSRLRSYITNPILSFQYPSFSDIHNTFQSYYFNL